ncbi:MAG: hypothetical protein ACRBM6_20690 [Geminicoccales bacterium]
MTGNKEDRLLMNYLRAHWFGRQALAWSFWINFALLFSAINLIEPIIRPSTPDRSWLSLAVAIIYLIIGHLIIYPWQVIGLLRACNRYLKGSSDTAIVTAAQGAVAVSAIACLVTMSTTLQSIFAPPQKTSVEKAIIDVAARIPDYEIHVLSDQSLIRINGLFDIGLTRDLKALLDRETTIEGIVLDSDGGRIYEARGVAKLIDEHALSTYVFDICQSACTTAFIAGTTRHLGEQGRLGFHQYRILAIHPFIDPHAEQEKDRAFYRSRGVKPDLLKKIFAAPHDSMWYPEMSELRNGNVIHRIIPHKTL